MSALHRFMSPELDAAKNGVTKPAGFGHLTWPPVDAVAPSHPTTVGSQSGVINDEQKRLLNGIAAMQLRYGQPEEALALLQLVDRLSTRDGQTLRLMVQAFIALGETAGAEAAFQAWRTTQDATRFAGLRDIMKAFVLLAGGRLAEARTTFQRAIRANPEK